MAVLLQETYGSANNSSLVSGVPVSEPGIRFIDHSDVVGPERTNRPTKNLLMNDNEINLHLNELTSLVEDGVFVNFGEEFLPVLTGTVNNTSISFQIREGLGKIDNNAFHLIYEPNSRIDYDVDNNKKTIEVVIPPQITTININVQNIGNNQYRRDLVTLDNTGEVVVIQGTVSDFVPAEYSQIDAPNGSISLYSILFRKTGGNITTPTINAIFNVVEIEGVDLIKKFAELFGNGIFYGEPETETDPTKIEFTPSISGGETYAVSAGAALIKGKLIKYGAAGNSIILTKATKDIGTASVPGTSPGQNENNWELVDFNSTDVGASGTGAGNTQFLKYDVTGLAGYIDPASIVIYTAAAAGEGGYTTQRPFDTNILNAPTTEEYSIDLNTGTIKREKTTAPLKIYIKYSFARNRRYLPYIDENGAIQSIQSATDTYPGLPAEFTASQLPADTIGLKSILFASTDNDLQTSNLGSDFRTYINFQLEDGQVISQGIKDGAITSSKIASGAINNSAQIADGTIVASHLSSELQDFLSSSQVFVRNSLPFKFSGSDTDYSFVDYTDGNGNLLTKQLTRTNGTNLIFTDAELQNPSDRPVVSKDVFKEFISTEVTTNPENATSNFTITSASIGNITITNNTVKIDAVSVSFQDFGFSQVGDFILIVYDASTNQVLSQKNVPLSTIKSAVTGQADSFYKFTLDAPIDITIGQTYQIRMAKQISTDTVYVHTASEGASRNSDVSYRVFYLPTGGLYGFTSGKVQGFRIEDDFGDITSSSTERLAAGSPAYYIPYAANISDRNTFTVFTDVDSDINNYVAVDLTRGIFKFSPASEPTSSKLLVSFNIIQGMNNLSSARIHRDNGETIEHALRVLETELGSVKAHVRNQLELLNYLGNGKFNFSSEDRSLTDLSGTNLDLKDGNLINPIHVTDTLYIVPEGRETSRQIQSSFNDTDVIEFTPRADNVAIFAINFAEDGTNYDAIQIDLHEGVHVAGSYSNPPIASATLAKSAIKTDFNFFALESDLTIGTTYHVYIKVINFAGGLSVRPEMKVDVENGMIEFQEYFLPEPGKYGTPNGYTIFDLFGDLNLGSEARGAETDVSQENFLDSDGHQVQPFFDDNDQDPSQANTTFPIFSPTKPSTTGMVRFDIYFKTVPAPGEDGYNGSFRLMLHDSNNVAVVPSNALPGNDFIDVKIPKTTGWLEIPFVTSLSFGESYHMHIWGNGADLFLYVGEHPVSQQKAYRYISGDRFVVFAADLSGDKFDSFQIVTDKLVAVDVVTGRIKFNPEDLTQGNKYFGNFNLFTKSADLQSDTIIRPNEETIENALKNIVPIRSSEPKRVGIDQYTFNPRSIQLVDGLGRKLTRTDGELEFPYERISLEDTDTAGTPSQITTNEADNTYTFFIDFHEAVEIPAIKLNFSAVQKSYFNTILNIYQVGQEQASQRLAQAYIRSKDLVVGENEIVLENISGEAINFNPQPNTQYVFKYIADVQGVGVAPTLSQNVNGSPTTTLFTKPTTGGFYGNSDGIVIRDNFGDVFRYNIGRDTLSNSFTFANVDSGAVSLNVKAGTENGIAIWQENNNIKGKIFQLSTGRTLKDLDILNSSSILATQPNLALTDDVAMAVWVQSGSVYGRRIFINESDPFIYDSGEVKLSDDGFGSNPVTGIAWPGIGADRDRVVIAWEDGRHGPASGDLSATANDKNIFVRSFGNFTTAGAWLPSSNQNITVKRLNETNLENSEFLRPQVSVYEDYAVIVYQSDVNNLNTSNDIMLSVQELVSGEIIRSDIRVDKAPQTDFVTQLDSINPKITSFRNKHVIAWNDNRNAEYHVFGKVYDSKELTFDQSDIQFESDSVSGTLNFNIAVNKKLVTLSYVDIENNDERTKRIDLNSLTDHDSTGFKFDFDNTSSNFIEAFSIPVEKKIYNFALTQSKNKIVTSNVEGINIEPVSIDLTNFTTPVTSSYIGIDVVTGRFKFADGEEI